MSRGSIGAKLRRSGGVIGRTILGVVARRVAGNIAKLHELLGKT
jgi:hypothetical protein